MVVGSSPGTVGTTIFSWEGDASRSGAGCNVAMKQSNFDDMVLRPKAEVSAVWDILHLHLQLLEAHVELCVECEKFTLNEQTKIKDEKL